MSGIYLWEVKIEGFFLYYDKDWYIFFVNCKLLKFVIYVMFDFCVKGVWCNKVFYFFLMNIIVVIVILLILYILIIYKFLGVKYDLLYFDGLLGNILFRVMV